MNSFGSYGASFAHFSTTWTPISAQHLHQTTLGMMQSLQQQPLVDSQFLQPLQQTVQQMGAMMQGPLAQWTPNPALPFPAPAIAPQVAQFLGMLQTMLQQMMQLPFQQFPFSSAPALPPGTQGPAPSSTSPYAATGASSSDASSDMVGSDGKTPNKGVKAAQNMTPEEIKSYQNRINKAMKKDDDNKVVALAKDPKAMAVATPDQKARMIRQLIRGWTKNKEDQAMYDIAASCTTKEEFEEVMNKAGGKKVVDEMDLGSAKKRMNMLCGMWGHTEWANNKGQAETALNALVDKEKGAELAGISMDGIDVLNPPLLTGDVADQAIAGYRHKRASQSMDIHHEPKAYKELLMTNAERKKQGKEPLNWAKMNQEVLGVLESESVEIDGKTVSTANPKEKEKAIEQLRKKYGLSKSQMREMVTQRNGSIFKESSRELKAASPELLNDALRRYQNARNTYGPDSSEAIAAKAHLDRLQQKLDIESKRVGEVGKKLEEMYPVPKGFWEKVVDAFKAIGKWLYKIVDLLSPLLNLIPGIGTALYAGYQGVKFIVNAIKGDIGGMIGSLASFAGGVGAAVGGAVGAAINTASKVIQAGKGVVEAAVSGNPLALLSAAGSAVGNIGSLGNLGSGVTKALQTTQKAINIGTAGASVIQGAATGNLDQALTGLSGVAGGAGGLAGGKAGEVLTNVGKGIGAANNLAHGRVGQALAQTGDLLQPIGQGNPGVQKAMDIAQKGLKLGAAGAGLIQGAASGNLDQALEGLGGVVQQTGDLAGQSSRKIFEHIGQGISVARSIGQGRYGDALGQLNNALSPLSNVPEAKNVMNILRPGLDVAAGIANGSYADAARSLANGLKPMTAQSPELREALNWLEPSARFAEGLANGKPLQAFDGFANQWLKTFDSPELNTALRWAGDVGDVFQKVQQGDPAQILQSLGQSAPMQELLKHIDNGQLQQGLQTTFQQFGDFLQHQDVKETMRWMQESQDVLQRLQQGHLLQSLQPLQQAQLAPEVRNALSTVMNQQQAWQPWFQGLQHDSFGHALGALQQVQPHLFAEPAMLNFLQPTAHLQNFVQELTQGTAVQRLQSLLEGVQNVQKVGLPQQELEGIESMLQTGVAEQGSLELWLKSVFEQPLEAPTLPTSHLRV
jgi:hypothetical protein